MLIIERQCIGTREVDGSSLGIIEERHFRKNLP